MSKYIIAIDVGTTGAKAVVLDPRGSIKGSGYREYPCIYPEQGWVEQSAELLIQETFEACRIAIKESRVDVNDILALGFSAQRATFGLLDKDYNIINDRFYVWQDNRATSEMEYIKSKMDTYEMYCIEGQPITPTFSFEKLIWIMNNQPDIYNKTYKLTMVPDYVAYRFGVEDIMCEVANAGCSGMVDINENTWSEHIIDTYGIKSSIFPELIDSGIPMGTIGKEAMEKTGLSKNTVIVSGSGDNQCGALGAGVIAEGNASMSLGTSGVLVVGSEKPAYFEDMALMIGKALAPNLYELEGIQLGAASSYRWIRDILCKNEVILGDEIDEDPYNLMESHINNSDVGSNGVLFLPFLNGSGYPYWNAEAKGTFTGISFRNNKSDMVRAVMEGITLESKDMYESIKKSGVDINSLTIIGGATRSKAWRQMIADMFNVTVKRLVVSDSTLIGAGIMAGVGVGIFKNVAEGVKNMVHFVDEVHPIPQNVEQYNGIYKRYKAVYDALSINNTF